MKILKKINTPPLDISKLNNLKLNKVRSQQFPSVNIIKCLPNTISLYETVIVCANDMLVQLYLNKKINYIQINKIMAKLINNKAFTKYKKIVPKKIQDIIFVKNHVSSHLKKNLNNV